MGINSRMGKLITAYSYNENLVSYENVWIFYTIKEWISWKQLKQKKPDTKELYDSI